jgi:hypothetical protein
MMPDEPHHHASLPLLSELEQLGTPANPAQTLPAALNPATPTADWGHTPHTPHPATQAQEQTQQLCSHHTACAAAAAIQLRLLPAPLVAFQAFEFSFWVAGVVKAKARVLPQ